MKESFPQTATNSEVDATIEEQMLDALELFRYSFSFRDQLFVVGLENSKSLEKLLTDFQVIQSSQIYLLVVLEHSDEAFSQVIESRRDGLLIEYIRQNVDEPFSRDKLKAIRTEYASHDIVVVGLVGDSKKIKTEDIITESLEISGLCSAKKFFFVNESGPLTINNKQVFHISYDDLKKSTQTDIVKPSPELLNTLTKSIPSSRIEVVLIDDAPGAFFQEIFTHQGRGTLITDEYPNIIRWGEAKDIFSISRLMKPYIDRGILLPVHQDELKSEISHFLLYTINDAIVAGARMYHYDDAVELAKFFCLPRFRRRGHARSLALDFIDQSRKLGKKYVFSLSVSEGMWEFLKSLDFVEVDRNSLPQAWKDHYDFNRASKAYKLDL